MIDGADRFARLGAVVECKHTDVVGRPVIQKLRSEIQTYDYDGSRRRIAATIGRFTPLPPSEEYTECVSATSDDALRPTTRRRLRR